MEASLNAQQALDNSLAQMKELSKQSLANLGAYDSTGELQEQIEIMFTKMQLFEDLISDMRKRDTTGPIVNNTLALPRELPGAMAGDGVHGVNNLGVLPQQDKNLVQQKLSVLWFGGFIKFVGWTSKHVIALLFLLTLISISSSMIWDFRIVEPQFIEFTNGLLSQKIMKAIRQWQLAVNQLAFDLDPKYPIHKFEEENYWKGMNYVFGH